jgi:hypothetical protein
MRPADLKSSAVAALLALALTARAAENSGSATNLAPAVRAVESSGSANNTPPPAPEPSRETSRDSSPDSSRDSSRSSSRDSSSRSRKSYSSSRNSSSRDSSSSPSREISPGGKLDFSSFKILSERNIFNPDRYNRSSSRPPSPPPEAPRPSSPSEAFSLVGTLASERGFTAFFDGTSSSFRKALKPDDTIGGLRVRSIGKTQVVLASANAELVVKVGNQLRRYDQGEWQVSGESGSYSSTRTTSSDSTTSSSSGTNSASTASTSSSDSKTDSASGEGMSEALKRLLQRREKEN